MSTHDEIVRLATERGRLLERVKAIEDRLEELRLAEPEPEAVAQSLAGVIRDIMAKDPVKNFTTSEINDLIQADPGVLRVTLDRLVGQQRIERLEPGVFRATDKINAPPKRARRRVTVQEMKDSLKRDKADAEEAWERARKAASEDTKPEKGKRFEP